jgi:hypothetical protein
LINFSPLLVVIYKDLAKEVFHSVLLAEAPNATTCVITDDDPIHIRRPRQIPSLDYGFWLTKVVYERMPG